jgi:hypothetical protein
MSMPEARKVHDARDPCRIQSLRRHAVGCLAGGERVSQRPNAVEQAGIRRATDAQGAR